MKGRGEIRHWLQQQGLKVAENITNEELVVMGYAQLGLAPPLKLLGTKARVKSRFRVLNRRIKKIQRPKKKRREFDGEIDTKVFYASYDWRKLRYRVLLKYGRRCQCCGRTSRDGVVIHVDHIKPLRKHWESRLDFDNLQVLCELCNHGKGNWDDTDWREPRLATLMGEAVE